MKKIAVFVLMAAFAFASCQNAEKTTTSPDLRAFGMKGDVKMVLYSVLLLDTSSEDEQGDPWLEQDELLMSFDREGRVIRDENGNMYEYDDDGNFVAGLSDRTVMTRDDKGRIVHYDNTDVDWESDDVDIYDYVDVVYTYDDKGRVATEENTGWEWMTTYTYHYDGDNIYPSSIDYESFIEAWIEKGTITYDYTEFDAKGNWTERIVTDKSEGYEEPWEENQEPEVEESYQKTRQNLEIIYWSDED